VRFNKLITSVGYLTAGENKVELLTIKFYNLHIIFIFIYHKGSKNIIKYRKLNSLTNNQTKHIVNVKKFYQKSVCHKIEGVQLFVQIHAKSALIAAILVKVIIGHTKHAFSE